MSQRERRTTGQLDMAQPGTYRVIFVPSLGDFPGGCKRLSRRLREAYEGPPFHLARICEHPSCEHYRSLEDFRPEGKVFKKDVAHCPGCGEKLGAFWSEGRTAQYYRHLQAVLIVQEFPEVRAEYLGSIVAMVLGFPVDRERRSVACSRTFYVDAFMVLPGFRRRDGNVPRGEIVARCLYWLLVWLWPPGHRFIATLLERVLPLSVVGRLSYALRCQLERNGYTRVVARTLKTHRAVTRMLRLCGFRMRSYAHDPRRVLWEKRI